MHAVEFGLGLKQHCHAHVDTVVYLLQNHSLVIVSHRVIENGVIAAIGANLEPGEIIRAWTRLKNTSSLPL